MPARKTRNQPPVGGADLGLWLTLAAALIYCLWIASHWLALGLGDKELAASASRVWDIRRELFAHHRLPWWTANFMAGSSYALHHTRGLYVAPWILFSSFTDLISAGKLVCLAAIFGGAVAMYFCARRFLSDQWAAMVAAIAFLLHPAQLVRAAGAEHVTISLSFLFIPLLWLSLARALESPAFRTAFACAAVAVLAWWADNKQAFIHFLFLGAYAVVWLAARPQQRRRALGALMLIAAIGGGLGAPLLVPGIVESKHVKLFAGDPLEAWQRGFSFKSILQIADRAGATSGALAAALQRRGGAPTPAQSEAVERLIGLAQFAPEKYVGLILLGLIAAALLWGERRAQSLQFWFFISAFLASIALATGPGSVWSENAQTLAAMWAHQSSLAIALVAGPLAVLLLFAWRNRRVPRMLAAAAAVLAPLLFVPWFAWLRELPYFADIRAPFVFYDGPATFFAALLGGFFVSAVLRRWQRHLPLLTAAIVILLFLDFRPYQRLASQPVVAARTAANLRATYSALAGDTDWVKTYSVSSRYFHLLGPTYSGKPQVSEAFYDWMAPAGAGILQAAGGGTREFLDLMAARYVVFDKTDAAMQGPHMQQWLGAYREVLQVVREDDDFVTFRNDAANGYVTAYARACAYSGPLDASAPYSLVLAGSNWPLVHAVGELDAARYEKIYRPGDEPNPPAHAAELVALADLRLRRKHAQLVEIELTAPQPALIVIAEHYYPFWTATVDARPVQVERVSTALMGVTVGAGAHRIELQYRPPRLYAAAAALSALTLLACTVLAWRRAH